MARFATPLLPVCLCAFASGVACDSTAPAPSDSAKADKEQAEKKAEAEKRAEEDAKARAEAKKLEEEKHERVYQEAKVQLDPLAKLPKKHPKGFATACAAMLEQYDAFMQRSLQGDALAKWNNEDKEGRAPVLRRECHKRAVPVVVCQTVLLEKAPTGADVDHMFRVCEEKFG